MWCPRCHTEVAAEIAPNGQSLNCTACGTEIQRVYAPSLHPDTRSARELLERWSKSEMLDLPSSTAHSAEVTVPADRSEPPVESLPLAASSELSSEDPVADSASTRRERPERGKPDRPTPKPRTTWRVDAPHNLTQPAAPLPPPVPPRRPHFSATVGEDEETTAAVPSEPPVASNPEPVATASLDRSQPIEAPPAPSPVAQATRTVHRRLDPPQESIGGPHFDLQAFLAQDARKPGRSESIWGQVLAYLGVGMITVGTTMVLWGWFGKTQQYAPTGWLICTIGQMMLFLGVTTLISGGMQQASHEVTRRVEYLGDRILRFEQSTGELLRGPHFLEREKSPQRESTHVDSSDS